MLQFYEGRRLATDGLAVAARTGNMRHGRLPAPSRPREIVRDRAQSGAPGQHTSAPDHRCGDPRLGRGNRGRIGARDRHTGRSIGQRDQLQFRQHRTIVTCGFRARCRGDPRLAGSVRPRHRRPAPHLGRRGVGPGSRHHRMGVERPATGAHLPGSPHRLARPQPFGRLDAAVARLLAGNRRKLRPAGDERPRPSRLLRA